MTEKFDLSREQNIDNNIDALGRKWNIVHIRGSALYEIRSESTPHNFIPPKLFKGRFTKPDYALERIKKYVTETWDNAEVKQVKADRKRQAAKEAKNKKTASESLAELDPKIKEALGDDIQ